MSNAVAMQTQGRVSTRVSAKVAFGKTAEAHHILDIVKVNFPEYGQFWDYTRDFITVEERYAKGDYPAALAQLRDMWPLYPQYKRAMFSRAQHIMADMEVELLREMREIHALLLGDRAELTQAQIVDRVADILDLYRELWDKYPTKKHHKLIAQRAEMLAAMVRQLTSPPRPAKKAPVIISRIPGPLTYYVYKDPATGEWVTPDDPTVTEIGPTGQCTACGEVRTVIDASRAEAQQGRCENCHEEDRPLIVRRPKRITPYRPPLAA